MSRLFRRCVLDASQYRRFPGKYCHPAKDGRIVVVSFSVPSVVPINILSRFQVVAGFCRSARVSFVEGWLTRKDEGSFDGVERAEFVVLFKGPARRVNGFGGGCVGVVVLRQSVSPTTDFRASVARRLPKDGQGIPSMVPKRNGVDHFSYRENVIIVFHAVYCR